DDGEDFRDFDKAEADWDEDDVTKVKQQIKNSGRANATPANESNLKKLVSNGEDPDTSDDEELDATFEEEDSDGSGGSGNSDEDSSEADDDDSDDDSDEDDEEEDDD